MPERLFLEICLIMYRIFALLLFLMPLIGISQSVLPLRADTIRMEKLGGSAELHLRNATRDTLGVLTNIGNGRTRFIRARIVGDTLFVGRDTLIIATDPTIQEVINNGNTVSENDSINVDPSRSLTIHGGTGSSIILKALQSAVSHTRIVIQPATLGLEYRDLGTGNLKQFILSSANGINVNDGVNTTGMGYGANYRTNGIANFGARWIPDIGAVRQEISDSLGGASSGINELTGDVTAGPGTGSQAATIANNAVSNAKFRQSVGTSIVGRSANSTGNVADIVASVASTFLKRNSTSLLFDSVDYAELKNKPDLQNPGVYFGPAESFDPSFVVFASCIPRTANSYSNGADIEWLILDHATDHNSSFYDSVYGGGANQLIVRFPTVKNVLNTTITPDEALSGALTVMGTSTGLYQFDAYVWQPFSTSIRLTGNGTSSWTKNSDVSIGSYFDLSTISSGATGFNISTGVNISYDGIGIQYIGPNGYGIKRTYSGLGSYNASFTLIDGFGNPVTTNPTSADEIIMTNAGMGSRQLNMTTWRPENQFISTFANFWIFGAYECWLVAAPTSTSSIQVRWQNYPSASSYKIYRATSLYGSRTLIHNGGGNAVTDSGLSTGTVYYYFFVPVISGVDTEITHFRTNTK